VASPGMTDHSIDGLDLRQGNGVAGPVVLSDGTEGGVVGEVRCGKGPGGKGRGCGKEPDGEERAADVVNSTGVNPRGAWRPSSRIRDDVRVNLATIHPG
jgi:hypothetical protein